MTSIKKIITLRATRIALSVVINTSITSSFHSRTLQGAASLGSRCAFPCCFTVYRQHVKLCLSGAVYPARDTLGLFLNVRSCSVCLERKGQIRYSLRHSVQTTRSVKSEECEKRCHALTFRKQDQPASWSFFLHQLNLTSSKHQAITTCRLFTKRFHYIWTYFSNLRPLNKSKK